jgi:hypothetical protein
MKDRRGKGRRRDDVQPKRDNAIVSANENSSGEVGFDDLGNARWKFSSEASTKAKVEAEHTFDLLKALDNDSIELAEGKLAVAGEKKPVKQTGYNPYDAGRDDSAPKPTPPKKR